MNKNLSVSHRKLFILSHVSTQQVQRQLWNLFIVILLHAIKAHRFRVIVERFKSRFSLWDPLDRPKNLTAWIYLNSGLWHLVSQRWIFVVALSCANGRTYDLTTNIWQGKHVFDCLIDKSTVPSDDVAEIQTTKLLIILKFYFHDV